MGLRTSRSGSATPSAGERGIGADEQAFAVLLPDDLVLPTGVLSRMAEVRTRFGGSVLCAFDIPRSEISAYGVFEVSDTDDADVKQVHGMVEKPAADEAPSTFAAAGRYLLDVAIFDALDRITPGAGGELQLTDAVAAADLGGAPGSRRRAPRRAGTTSATPAATSAPSSTSPSRTPSTDRSCAPG